jgi:restriction system protein
MSAHGESDRSDQSDMSDTLDRLLPPHGGYRKLRSFQTAQLIYDGTLVFCDRFIEKRSRTHDQMVQAARSGVQNIAEGSVASGTSKKSELKLTNVARASLEELLLDFQDFLRQRGLRLWPQDSPEALAVRRHYQTGVPHIPSRPAICSDPYGFRTAAPETAANTLLCLVNQASYLLARQLQNLEREFLDHGGFTERLHASRSRERQHHPPVRPTDDITHPACPCCGKPMVRRSARQGPHAGQPFWGCSAYPDCTGTRPIVAR